MAVRGMEAGTGVGLVISECQKGMTDPAFATNRFLADQVAARGVIPAIARLAARVRAAGAPVVHVTVAAYPGHRGWVSNCTLTGVFRKRPLTVGAPAVAIHDDLTPQPGDFLIERHRGITAFHGTELEYLLRNLGVGTVILTGVSTNVALPGSCIEAVNRGFQVVLPEDCTAGATAETHAFMIENTLPLLATVTTSAEVAAALPVVDGALA